MADPVGECILTLAGIDAYVQASATGSQIQPKSFKISATDHTLDPTITDITGWFEADISVYAAEYDADTVEFILDVPPASAENYCRTAGLYLEDGTLFALAKPPYALPPAVHQQLKVQIVYSNAVALTDFVYLSWDEQEQDIALLSTQVTLGDQILKNAADIGRVKEWLVDLAGKVTTGAAGSTGGGLESDLLGQVLTNFVIQSFSEKISRVSGATGSVHLNSDLYPVFDVSIGAASVTFVFSGDLPTDKARSFELYLAQNATAQTITWPSSVIWSGGEAPDLTANSSIHAFVFKTLDGGAVWWGFHASKEAA